jgi:hypothetical protein
MTTFALVAILGILLILVLKKLAQKPATPGPKDAPAGGPSMDDLANLKPGDARPGDVISIAGAGDQMTDLDFTSDRSVSVEAGARRWFELSGPYRDRRVIMRVGGDEDVEVSIQIDPRKLTLEDLGVSEDDLAQMDERQNTADNFEFDGKTWMYRMSREVQTRRSDQPGTAGYYYWEFREQGGPGALAIRKPEGEPFTVALFREVHPGDVTVYRGGKS